MSYSVPHYLTDPVGNNAFSYEERSNKRLFVPSVKDGSLEDVRIGSEIVFEDRDESGVLRSCPGLEHFIRTDWNSIPLVVVDNHNHVLYFWYEALVRSVIARWTTLVHIDEHSDLWRNVNSLDVYDAGGISLEKIYLFTNYSCNVGNYIQPALREWIIEKVLRVEGETDMDRYGSYVPDRDSPLILNLDLDFFAPELDYISFEKKREFILRFARGASLITIATSPFFIDQKLALKRLHDVFGT